MVHPPERRNVSVQYIPEELINLLEEALSDAYAAVDDERRHKAGVSLTFSAEYDEEMDSTIGSFKLASKKGDRNARIAGYVRDGQLCLPGMLVRGIEVRLESRDAG